MRTAANISHSKRLDARIIAARWNQRLLIAATVMILCGFSILAPRAAGPEAQAMTAAEGMLISGAR